MLVEPNTMPWNSVKNETFIVAEIGQNHQGSLELAKEMIILAKKSGANCVKFQKTCLTEKFNREFLAKPYEGENSWGHTYGEHKKYLEFTEKEFMELQQYCEQHNVMFTASAMDLVSLHFLKDINVPFIKIGSGDNNNLFLIKEAAKTGIPLMISTGMQDMFMVETIYKTVSKYHKNFCLLHCVSSYPTPIEEINLNVIKQFKSEFPDIDIGYSGHELGIDISVAAVALGAKVVERHFTIHKQLKGSDHVCSLEPNEFQLMVKKIRMIERSLGQFVKEIQPSEGPCYQKLRKTLVVTRPIKSGTVLNLDDIAIKVAEPKGIDGFQYKKVIGKKVVKDLDADQSLTTDCLLDFYHENQN